MTTLLRFLTRGTNKGFPYYQSLRKNVKFFWMEEHEHEFVALKEFLSNLPILN